VDIDAMTTANWGVFKASQAFTGTLWAPRSADSRTTLPGGRGYTAWGSVYAHNSRISGNGADYSIYGGAIGVEKQLRSNRSVGAALGYDWGKVSPFSTSAVHQESFHLAAYGRAWHWCRNNSDSVSVDWSAAYGRTSSEHDSLPGDWTQDSLQLDARATYQRRLTHRTTVSAFAGAQYYAQGSDTSGDNKAKAMHNLRFMLGGGISYALTDRTQLFGEAALHQDADRHNPTVTANGARFNCTNPGRSGVSISAGVEHQLNTRCSLRGSYRFSTADDQNEHNINVGAAYQF
jgi:opacity protein-like surface antigen